MSLLPVACQREVICGVSYRVLSLDVPGMQCFARRRFSRGKACQPELRSASSVSLHAAVYGQKEIREIQEKRRGRQSFSVQSKDCLITAEAKNALFNMFSYV